MNERIGQVLAHASIATGDLPRILAFYDRVLGTLGCRRMREHPEAVGYGRDAPEFWVQVAEHDDAAGAGSRGVHVGLAAHSRDQVDAFYQAARAAGGEAQHPPEQRPHAGEPVYAVFVRDPEGRVLEAVYRDMHSPPESGRA